MKLTGNTILITGGGSGIGRGLAEACHQLGNKVIVAGRRQATLDEVIKANPGIVGVTADMDDPASIRALVKKVVAEHPELNVLINNAGIMKPENLRNAPDYLSDSEAVLTTNLLGPIRLIAHLLPHLQSRPQAAVINVSSGLAFVPLPATPTYNATKAALHSYTISLRVQLQRTSVEVIEIIPPAVATDLTPGRTASASASERMMPLPDFISETMSLFQQQPTPSEICVERVNFLRKAESAGTFEKALGMLSEIKV